MDVACRRLSAAVAIALAATLAACSPAATLHPSEAPTPGGSDTLISSPLATNPVATPDRVAGWRSDLERLVPGMDAIHPDLGHDTPLADLEAAVGTLIGRIDAATDDELMVGVLGIVAMVSVAGCDGHTGAFIWGTGSYPVDSLPLRLWLFEDEVVIVDALPPYEGLIGSRIDAIEGHSIDDVIAAMDPIIPRDNTQTVRLLAPRYLLIPQVLRGLGLADAGPVTLDLTGPDGDATPADIEPVSMSDYNDWAGPYGLHLPSDPDVLSLSRIGEALWWELLPDAATLYVQYNRTDPFPSAQMADLEAAFADPDVARIVLDIRHNFGGELSALDAMMTLYQDPSFDQPDRLFVITGRNTFSAGSLMVARLERDTAATFVGEAPGGCPTLFSDSSELRLPFSGIAVSVAGDRAIGASDDDPRTLLEPDLPVPLTREAWADGRDLALEAIVVVAP